VTSSQYEPDTRSQSRCCGLSSEVSHGITLKPVDGRSLQSFRITLPKKVYPESRIFSPSDLRCGARLFQVR
jgi:hypothetical protein